VSASSSDPQRPLDALRQRAARAQLGLAAGFSRAVGRARAERLEQLMRTPARRIVLDAIFWQMPNHLDRKRAAGTTSSVRWCITGRADGRMDVYQLNIADGRCRLLRNPTGPDARVTLTVDGVEFLRIASGNSDPMKAYFSGKIKIAGDIMLAAKLSSLFRIPSAAGGPPRA
jgi:putative sterol carrier protein